MKAIRVVLDRKLLEAADRSLDAHVEEDRDRDGYAKYPQKADEIGEWEDEAAWPEE